MSTQYYPSSIDCTTQGAKCLPNITYPHPCLPPILKTLMWLSMSRDYHRGRGWWEERYVPMWLQPRASAGLPCPLWPRHGYQDRSAASQTPGSTPGCTAPFMNHTSTQESQNHASAIKCKWKLNEEPTCLMLTLTGNMTSTCWNNFRRLYQNCRTCNFFIFSIQLDSFDWKVARVLGGSGVLTLIGSKMIYRGITANQHRPTGKQWTRVRD